MPESAQQGERSPRGRNGGNPNWKRGESAYPYGRESNAARQARRDALIAEWAAPHGGVATLRPAELSLLNQAAELMLRPQPRKVDGQVRIANSVSRIIKQVFGSDARQSRKRAPASTSTSPSLPEMMARHRP
jgi:hypothetical protein